jgi:hypothetical protein
MPLLSPHMFHIFTPLPYTLNDCLGKIGTGTIFAGIIFHAMVRLSGLKK